MAKAPNCRIPQLGVAVWAKSIIERRAKMARFGVFGRVAIGAFVLGARGALPTRLND
ncbi:hypothetical protein K227x_21270 [Rubripirellula lacrimiformis]|uniref:Uncharacterized protein n=1 Tax=Rubripirellula lacrimiformis TaxID=1930273 RepID=A0A517N9E2_9BACT|nr:hypothetical protein K227x_21270 [Rubripirellula lacrimiformis]